MKSVNDLGFDLVIHEVECVLGIWKNFSENAATDKGGFFTLLNHAGPSHVALSRQVGEVESDNLETYLGYSREKATRLLEKIGHMSSWQSREPENKKWGGAIRVHNVIFSFSGLSEMADEALMLVSALNLNALSRGIARNIAMTSKNPFFAKFYDFSR